MGASFYTATTQLANGNLINSRFREPDVYSGSVSQG